nr:histidine--tRNA ligase [Salisediminibacterium selenitireducens]
MKKKQEDLNVKGTVTYMPEKERVRRRIRRTLEDVFIRYGCEPLETPILNQASLMTDKYGGGAEIVKEMYRLTDQGERDLALRYDLTMPFARVCVMNPTLRKPFKRYEIGKVFRDGPIKAGRYREFTQCDVDVLGVSSQLAEAELMIMALDAFERLGMAVTIQYNNRKFLTGLLDVFGVPESLIPSAVLTLDKLEKKGAAAVLDELLVKGVTEDVTERIGAFLTAGDAADIERIRVYGNGSQQVEEGAAELQELTSFLGATGTLDQCVFNPFLARGLEIYTGTVYEVFSAEPGALSSSIASGGRYDQAVGGLSGSDEGYPSVGISFGLDVITTVLESRIDEEIQEEKVDCLIIPVGEPQAALVLAQALRAQGTSVELDMSGKKPGKALERANREGVRDVILIGSDEVETGIYTVKRMKTGEEEAVSFSFGR